MSGGAENYGWRLMEGSNCFNPSTGCNNGSLTLPILEYGHDQGCSVTAGFRYRGSAIPALVGTYLYADFCNGRIWGANPAADGSWETRVLLESGHSISSFGENDEGELYLTDYSGGAGVVFKLVGEAFFRDGFESGDTSAWRARRPRRLAVVEPGLADRFFALAVSLAADGKASSLRATRPRNERRIVVDFELAANQAEVGDGEVEILALVGNGERHLRLTLEQRGRQYRLNLYDLDRRGRMSFVGTTRIARKRATHYRLEWSRASAPDRANGTLLLFKNRRLRVSARDLANGDREVDQLVIGLPDGVDRAGSGSFLFDEFVVRR